MELDQIFSHPESIGVFILCKIRQTRFCDYCVASESNQGRYTLALHDEHLITSQPYFQHRGLSSLLYAYSDWSESRNSRTTWSFVVFEEEIQHIMRKKYSESFIRAETYGAEKRVAMIDSLRHAFGRAEWPRKYWNIRNDGRSGSGKGTIV